MLLNRLLLRRDHFWAQRHHAEPIKDNDMRHSMIDCAALNLGFYEQASRLSQLAIAHKSCNYLLTTAK